MEKKSVFAKFYNRDVKTGKFTKEGLPEFVKKIYVEIRVVNSFDVVDRPAEREDFARFAQEYKMFLESAKRTAEGTPLNMFAFLTPAQIECCNIKDIYTVEELSGISKEKAKELGLESEVELAKKFLGSSKNNKAIAEANKKIEELEELVAGLKAENEELRKMYTEATTAQPAGGNKQAAGNE